MGKEDKIDLGTIQIHKNVLVDIAHSAIKEIEGVSLAPGDVGGQVFALFSKKETSGIRVFIDRDNQVSIEVKIKVRYGLNIPDVARQVQDAIREAVQQTADIKLNDIHVSIQRIERGQE